MKNKSTHHPIVLDLFYLVFLHNSSTLLVGFTESHVGTKILSIDEENEKVNDMSTIEYNKIFDNNEHKIIDQGVDIPRTLFCNLLQSVSTNS